MRTIVTYRNKYHYAVNNLSIYYTGKTAFHISKFDLLCTHKNVNQNQVSTFNNEMTVFNVKIKLHKQKQVLHKKNRNKFNISYFIMAQISKITSSNSFISPHSTAQALYPIVSESASAIALRANQTIILFILIRKYGCLFGH